MASLADLRRMADQVPWQHAGFQADLQRLTDSTAAASRAFAADCQTMNRLANMVPRARCDSVGATPWTSFRTEIAIAKNLSDRSAARFIRNALRISEVLLGTFRLLQDGLLPVHKALEFVGCLEELDDELAIEVELAMADRLLDLPSGRIKHEVAKIVLTLDADAAAAQAAKNASGRAVRVQARRGGMAEAFLFGPAVRTTTWYASLDMRARALQAQGDARTLDQLRFDLATGTFPCESHSPAADQLARDTDAAGSALRPSGLGVPPADCRMSRPAQALILVPVETALGLSSDPAWLTGYGYLSAPQTRQVVLDAELRKLLVHHRSGDLLDLDAARLRPDPGPRSYQDTIIEMIMRSDGRGIHPRSDVGYRTETEHDPSTSLAEFARIRDRYDDGPGKTLIPAARCDLDHDTAYDHDRPAQGGPTAAWNLIDRARRTHQLKHDGWTPQRTPRETIWTSPAGQLTYVPNWNNQPPGIDPPGEFTPEPHLPDPDELAGIDTELTRAETPDDIPPDQTNRSPWSIDPDEPRYLPWPDGPAPF